MAYTYSIDPKAQFEDRTQQFIGFGVPAAEVARLQTVIGDMWLDGPSGWVYEWSQLAARFAAQGDHYLASLTYGCAKFPCLADAPHARALAKQVEEYVAAAPTFPFRFERRILSLPYRGGHLDVPVHLLTTAKDYKAAPVLIASGGVDTWKMDIHQMLGGLVQHAGVTVLAFDQPGTGETAVPLSAASDEVVLGLVAAARAIGNGKVAHFGISFGANFAAMTGLTGAVDAAVVVGAPIADAFKQENAEKLPYGMFDIVGNALGFDHKPAMDEYLTASRGLARTALLERSANAAMLVINGADDYFVPQSDTRVFEGRPRTTVQLIPGTGHCAMSKMHEWMPTVIGWLRTQLGA